MAQGLLAFTMEACGIAFLNAGFTLIEPTFMSETIWSYETPRQRSSSALRVPSVDSLLPIYPSAISSYKTNYEISFQRLKRFRRHGYGRGSHRRHVLGARHNRT